MKIRNVVWLYMRHAPIETLILFLVRSCLWGFLRGLATNPRDALDLIKAVVATGQNLPMLLKLKWPRRCDFAALGCSARESC